MRSTGERNLVRELGPMAAAAIVVNATIGTGIFKKPAEIVRQAGSVEAAFVVWLLGAVLAFAGALCFSELAASMPRAGGMYEYLRRAFGPRVAFLYGWTKITLLLPSAVGSFALLAAEAITALFALEPDRTRDVVIAISIIVGCAGINVFGMRASALQQATITAVKYVGIVFLALLGLLAPLAPGADVPWSESPTGFREGLSAGGMFAALVAVMWAYDGWADLSSLAGETKNPGKTLPRALLSGTIAVAIGYLLVNLGYARVLGLDGLRHATDGTGMAAAHVADRTLGGAGRMWLSALVLVSCVGGCTASILTNSRTFVPMATDGVFIRWLGRVREGTFVPANAIVIGATLGSFYVSSRTFEQLTDAFVVGYFPFYALAVIALFRLRKTEPNLPRPFRMPFYPWPGLVFLVGSSCVLFGASTGLDGSTAIAGCVIVLGIPVSFFWMKKRA